MLQYIGFICASNAREYGFTLSEKELPSRLLTVSIANNLFGPGLLKFQEGPEICYGKLLLALAGEATQSSSLSGRQSISEAEVGLYRSAGKSKIRVWTEEQRLKARLQFKNGLKNHH